MYTAIKGVYENGQVILEEAPPSNKKAKVLVMFLSEESLSVKPLRKGVKIGSLAGKGYNIPDNFDDPVDDLKEYME